MSRFFCANNILYLSDNFRIDMPPVDNQYKLRNQEFLQEYAQKPGVNIMFNGVMYRVITNGSGPKPSPKSFITDH